MVMILFIMNWICDAGHLIWPKRESHPRYVKNKSSCLSKLNDEIKSRNSSESLLLHLWNPKNRLGPNRLDPNRLYYIELDGGMAIITGVSLTKSL